MKKVTFILIFLSFFGVIESIQAQGLINEESLKIFLNTNPHYKENLHQFHFYDFNNLTGATGGGKPKIRAFTRKFVFESNINVKYKNVPSSKVMFILFPVINNNNLVNSNSNILYIINSNNKLITVKASECIIL